MPVTLKSPAVFRAAARAIIGAVAATCLLSPTSSGAQAPASAAAPDPLIATMDRSRILGSESAQLWVLVVSDFQCPYCRQWHKETWDALRKEYVATGKVRVAYVNFPLSMHPNARPAAIAAMCAGAQGKFWQAADLIFNRQDRWKGLKDSRPFFDALVRETGVDPAKHRACADSPAVGSLIDADYTRMGRAGTGSTPTFFIGRSRLEGAEPIARFRQVIDAELAAAKRP
jgi:protein-disulfide isomerase